MNSELWRDYPVPQRAALPEPTGCFHEAFVLAHVENLKQSVPMDRDGFTAFVLTKSRSLAAVEWGGASLESLARARRERASALFGTDCMQIPFSGPIYLLRRN